MNSSRSGFDIVIDVPDPLILRIVARSVLLAAALISFPWWVHVISLPSCHVSTVVDPKWVNEPFVLPVLITDLKRQGLLASGSAAVFLGNAGSRLGFLDRNQIRMVSGFIEENSVDFVIMANGLTELGSVDRVVRVGGVVVVGLGSGFQLPKNYRLAYIRRFGTTFVGIKKMFNANVGEFECTGASNTRKLMSVAAAKEEMKAYKPVLGIMNMFFDNVGELACCTMCRRRVRMIPKAVEKMEDEFLESPEEMKSYKVIYLDLAPGIRRMLYASVGELGHVGTSRGRRLLSVARTKTEAMEEMEDVFFEPPEDEEMKSYKPKYLPELMGENSLFAYPKRIIIEITNKDEMTNSGWFHDYPMNGAEFEIIKVKLGGKGVVDWLKNNVKEEEFVVMKAEAREVEEILKDEEVMGLVDELVMECKTKMAYWECLRLYGRVRKAGVAIHQWWGE